MNLNIDPFLHLTPLLHTHHKLVKTRAAPYHLVPSKKWVGRVWSRDKIETEMSALTKNKPVQSGNNLKQVNQRKQHHWSSINGRISTVGYDWYDWLNVSLLTSPGQFWRCNIQIVASKRHSIVASAAKLARAMANHHHHPHGMQYAHWMLAFPFMLDGRQRSDQEQCPPSRGCYVMAKSL